MIKTTSGWAWFTVWFKYSVEVVFGLLGDIPNTRYCRQHDGNEYRE